MGNNKAAPSRELERARAWEARAKRLRAKARTAAKEQATAEAVAFFNAALSEKAAREVWDRMDNETRARFAARVGHALIQPATAAPRPPVDSVPSPRPA